LKKENIKMSNAVFIVTGEKSCPYYEIGDELRVESSTLSISSFKPACLLLAERLKQLSHQQTASVNFPHLVRSSSGKTHSSPTLTAVDVLG